LTSTTENTPGCENATDAYEFSEASRRELATEFPFLVADEMPLKSTSMRISSIVLHVKNPRGERVDEKRTHARFIPLSPPFLLTLAPRHFF